MATNQEIYTLEEEHGSIIVTFNGDLEFRDLLSVKNELIKIMGQRKFDALFMKFDDEITTYKLLLFAVDHYLGELDNRLKSKFGSFHQFSNNISSLRENVAMIILMEKRKNSRLHSKDSALASTVLKFSPYPNQLAAFEKMEKTEKEKMFRGIILAGRPGTGKTYMALYLSLVYNSDFTIIICPAKVLKNAWLKDLSDPIERERIYKKKQPVINGRLPVTENPNIRVAKYLVINYESVHHVEKNYLRQITNLYKNVTVIIDESHNLAHFERNRTSATVDFVDRINPNRVILLSGTDLKREIGEMRTILAFLYKGFIRDDFQARFDVLFGTNSSAAMAILSKLYRDVRIVVEHSEGAVPKNHLIEMEVKIPDDGRFSIATSRIRMREAEKAKLKEISDNKGKNEKRFDELSVFAAREAIDRRVTTRRSFDEHSSRRKELKSIKGSEKSDYYIALKKNVYQYEKDFIEPYLKKELKKEFRDIRSSLDNPYAQAKGVALSIIDKMKGELAVEVAKVIDLERIYDLGEKKVIFITQYIEVTYILENRIKKLGKKPIVMHSKSKYSISSDLDLFEKGKIDTLITTYKSASEGVRLTVADVLVQVDMPTGLNDLEQAKARTSRQGQDKETYLVQFKLNSEEGDSLYRTGFDSIREIAKTLGEIRQKEEEIDLIRYIAGKM